MKRLLLIAAIAALTAPCGMSQSKLNAAGALQLGRYKLETALRQGGDKSLSRAAAEEPQVSAIVILKEGVDDSILSQFDAEIVSSLDGVVVVNCPISECENIAALDEVEAVSFGETYTPMLDFARPASQAEEVQKGFVYDNATVSYNGKGIICGMFDTGLEANHVNFKNEDGTSRIQRLWWYRAGTAQEFFASNMGQFGTDDSGETHATHVAGIMAGSYDRTGKFGVMTAPDGSYGSIENDADIPYYGICTASDLAFGVGALTDAHVIGGVTNIIEYAEKQGKPAVVNLSLGSVIGPHDGTDAFGEAISRLGKRAIICVAAGNDGDMQLSLSKKLGASGNNAYLRTFPAMYIYNSTTKTNEYVSNNQTGAIDIWSSDSKPLTFSLKVCKGPVASAEDIVTITGPGTTNVNVRNNTTFANYFTGEATVQAALSSRNNRYEVYLTLSGVSLKTGVSGATLMLEVTGDTGTTVNMYGNHIYFSNKTASGSSGPVGVSRGNADNSISDMACCDNIISVGAYVSRSTWKRLDGAIYTNNARVGNIATFTSYGTVNGKNLPIVCAPGSSIVSSVSRYYVGSNTGSLVAEAANGGNKDYWGVMSGTSMATPYVSGVVGQWLEAYPNLKVEDVAEIITSTAVSPGLVSGTPKKQWGAGKVDALAGIKAVLKLKAESGINGVVADAAGYVIAPVGDRQWNVMVDGATDINAVLYNVQGVAVATASSQNGEVTLDASSVAPGVYVLCVTTPNASPITRKLKL